MKNQIGLMTMAVAMVASGVIAQAGYVDVTVGDPHANKTFTPGITGSTGPGNPGIPENNETEWNAVANQTWDLESFQFDSGSKNLKMTGGFNFATGVGYNGSGAVNLGSAFATLPMGDIFVYIDTGVPYVVNNPNDNPQQHSGPWTGANEWDYVVAFKRSSPSSVSNQNIVVNANGQVEYKIVASSANYLKTGGSSTLNSDLPWRFGTTGQTVAQNNAALGSAINLVTGDASFSVASYSSSGAINAGNKDSWLNSIFGLDLNNINLGNNAYFHTTMRCGNDVLWGSVSVADSGTTLVLLGGGLFGLGMVRRRWS